MLTSLLSCMPYGSQGKSRKARTPGVAEGVGFEPTEGTRPSTAFKAAAFVHSATPPRLQYRRVSEWRQRLTGLLCPFAIPPLPGRDRVLIGPQPALGPSRLALQFSQHFVTGCVFPVP